VSAPVCGAAFLSGSEEPPTLAVVMSGRVAIPGQSGVTFSAPKSVSLTALVGGDENVRVAHRESVNVALKLNELEHYVQARIGGNHAPETTGKWAVEISYEVVLCRERLGGLLKYSCRAA